MRSMKPADTEAGHGRCGGAGGVKSRGSRALLLALASALLASSALANAGVERSAELILKQAFENRFDVNTIANIELVMRDELNRELRRRLRGVSKVIDGRVHSLGKIVWPERLRGMTVLTIEALDRSHDAFVYLPSLGRVRRISTAQRGDAFFGTDVTYEDLERRRVSDYEISSIEKGECQGEPVYLIRARSLRDFTHQRVLFAIATSDGAILETRYFKKDEEQPFRLITAPREAMITRQGHVLPTRLQVWNPALHRTTEVTYRDLEINPEIDDHVFSVGTLDLERPIPRAKEGASSGGG